METIFSLGSNLNDRLELLAEAKKRILAVPDTGLVGRSKVYETEPVGVKPEFEELKYLNTVLAVESPFSGPEWLAVLSEIETASGRQRVNDDRFAPRTIDIDILFVGDQAIDSGGLTVPHPRWTERRFVLRPLCDICPDRVMLGIGKTVAELLDELPEGENVELWSEDW